MSAVAHCEPMRLSDVSEVCQMMNRSWSQDAQAALHFTPDFLQSFLCRPGELPSVALASYQGGTLAGVVFGSPRTVDVYGCRRCLLLMTFFTVAPEFKGQGIGKRLWAECLMRARELGYRGALHYCQEGNRSNDITVAAAAQLGLETSRVFTVSYLAKVVKQQHAEIETPAPTRDEVAALLCNANLPRSADMEQVWDLQTADWAASGRDKCWEMSTVGATALVGGAFLVAGDPGRTCYFVLDQLLWGRTDAHDRDAMLNRIVARVSSRVSLISVPILGYADTEQLKRAGFRRTPKCHNAYVTLWDGHTPSSLNSLYMDVM